LELISRFNWIDIFIGCVVFRILWISFRGGIVLEFFKLLGTIFAIYLSLHYYISLSKFVQLLSGLEIIPEGIFCFFWFCILATCGYMISLLIRELLAKFIKTEIAETVNHWGGLILGTFRGVLLTGLLLFILAISTVNYFPSSIKHSNFGIFFVRAPVVVYRGIWEGVTSRFFTDEKYNQAINEIEERFIK